MDIMSNSDAMNLSLLIQINMPVHCNQLPVNHQVNNKSTSSVSFFYIGIYSKYFEIFPKYFEIHYDVPWQYCMHIVS